MTVIGSAWQDVWQDVWQSVWAGAGTLAADFTSSVLSGTAPLYVPFVNASVGASSYRWFFTNGAVPDSTDPNPIAVYIAPGTYTVRLEATDGVTTDTRTRTGYIVVSAPVSGMAYAKLARLKALEAMDDELKIPQEIRKYLRKTIIIGPTGERK